jgi:superfamily II DNA helicase RecQ
MMPPRLQVRPKRFIDAEKHYPITHQTEVFMQELEEKFKFPPYPWQAHAIQSILEGHDIIVRVGTASGKSFVFQAMALAKPKAIVLVISPLVALMQNQVPSVLDKLADLRSKRLKT